MVNTTVPESTAISDEKNNREEIRGLSLDLRLRFLEEIVETANSAIIMSDNDRPNLPKKSFAPDLHGSAKLSVTIARSNTEDIDSDEDDLAQKLRPKGQSKNFGTSREATQHPFQIQ